MPITQKQRDDIYDVARATYETIAYDMWGERAESVDDDEFVDVMRDQTRFALEADDAEDKTLIAAWDTLTGEERNALLLDVFYGR
jgi:hypothetical protein